MYSVLIHFVMMFNDLKFINKQQKDMLQWSWYLLPLSIVDGLVQDPSNSIANAWQ